jgi:hypothetical protein
MASAAQVLVAYNRALHKAHTLNGLYQAEQNFRKTMKVPDRAKPIFDEHVKRVKGIGCPADCDEVTDILSRK